ncbi:MAG: phosphoenolpyruvate synthase [Candidatus Pacebacteria bacterium]|nr:phosphoenolpyruvate synthase [Candidatus Paceibacterota bacterium]
MSKKEEKNVLFFKQLRKEDVGIVGGKNSSLGEMYQKLTKKGVLIPNGFATTSHAYHVFMEEFGLKEQIKEIFKDLDTHDIENLMERGKKARELILKADFSKKLEEDILKAYRKLSDENRVKNLSVAVRSSATAEDLPDASFAGQQETFLNVSGEKELLIAVKKCVASLFTNRAISYRTDKGFDHFSIALSVGIQKMVRADKGSSGVMFTIDTESGFENVVLINSIYGLGENIVQGKVNPDEFYVFKPTSAILSRSIGKKKIKMIYNPDKKASNPVKDIPVSEKDQLKQSITDEQVLQLTDWGIIIEKHYKRPMDMEWALDGVDGKLYIVQARPETVQSQKDPSIVEEYKMKEKDEVLVEGQSVGWKIGRGVVNKILNVDGIKKFKKGEVLVTTMTDPDWEPIMKIASAIVTDKGGRTCHAAIVSRELGIPCIVGTNDATKKLNSGNKVTVSCAEGERGRVYKGELEFEVKRTKIDNLGKPKTKVMMHIGDPSLAFSSSFIPNDGVGLARLEFIINNTIKIHPLALLNYNKQDKKVKKQIDELAVGYKDKKQFFIDKLAEGVGTICGAFYPKEVIVRLSDFKTNEYANLIGGTQYEPIEANPMMGWRGASRYYSEAFLPAFEMECAALKKVRDDMGLKNLKVMIPICRTVEEGKKVLEIMEKNGLKRGENGLEIYVMAEVPSNIILAEKFAEIFDGFSIGSNDLTQFTLAIDRDSAGNFDVEGLANENNEAVKILLRDLIKKAKKAKTKVGICGQAPSDYPEMVEFLVECGIDSISLTPDTVIKSTQVVYKTEQKIKPACRQAGKK